MGIAKTQSSGTGGGVQFATASGTDTYTAALPTPLGSYATGDTVVILFTNANTGASTLNLDGLGAKDIRKNVSSALVAGDILAGQTLQLTYDGTNFQLSDGLTGPTGPTGASGVVPIATAAGTVDAITADYTPDLTLTNLVMCAFVASGANTSTTPTFAPDGLTARTIVKRGGQALSPGDIPGANAVCLLEYNSANTRWELLNPASIDTVTLSGSLVNNAVTAGATAYISAGTTSTSASEAARAGVIPVTGTAKYLYMILGSTGQPAGQTLTVTLRINGADTAVTFTVPTSAAAGSVHTSAALSVAVTQGDSYSIKLVQQAGANSGTIAGFSLNIERAA